VIRKTFLHDHGFETIPSKEPPDFNRWILSIALASVDAGEEAPFLEEAISIADRIQLPTLEDSFPTEAPVDPAQSLTVSHVVRILQQAREIGAWSHAEALRLAEKGSACAATLSCRRELKHDLVGFSLIVQANALRRGGRLDEAREALARGARLLAVGAGSLSVLACLLSTRGSLEQGCCDYRRAALASNYATKIYQRLHLATEAGWVLLTQFATLGESGNLDGALRCLEQAEALLPQGDPWALGIPSARAWTLSSLGQKDAALFELGLSKIALHQRPPLEAARVVWRAGIVERDSGSPLRARANFEQVTRSLERLGEWKSVVEALEDFALLERSCGQPEAMMVQLNRLEEVVSRYRVPRKHLNLDQLQF